MKLIKRKKIKKPEKTYNLHIKNSHNYIANDMVVANCHSAKAKSLTSIIEKMTDCPVKIGVTGTLDGDHINSLVIQGLFGPIKNFITTKQLMDKGMIAKLSINNLIFKYNEKDCKEIKKAKYADEIKYIVNHKLRNKLVAQLLTTQTKNTLFLANNIKHIESIKEYVTEIIDSERNVYVVTGATKTDVREEIRLIVENETNAIIIATYGVFSTGVSIKNIHSVVFGSPTKSQIRTLQSIGRGLRRSNTKSKVVLYDIIDDLSHLRHKNFALKHYIERQKIYSREKFDYSIHKFDL